MPNVMSWLVMSLRYATWFGVRPCRSARRVRSGGDSSSASPAGAGAAPRDVISISPSWMSSTDSGFSAAA